MSDVKDFLILTSSLVLITVQVLKSAHYKSCLPYSTLTTQCMISVSMCLNLT